MDGGFILFETVIGKLNKPKHKHLQICITPPTMGQFVAVRPPPQVPCLIAEDDEDDASPTTFLFRVFKCGPNAVTASTPYKPVSLTELVLDVLH